MPVKLTIFDLDDTVCGFNSDVLYPDSAAWFEEHTADNWIIASNQGGVGLRYWMESGDKVWGKPQEYPTLADTMTRLSKLFPNIPLTDYDRKILFACRYQAKSGKWSPIPPGEEDANIWRMGWRKPAPGMLEYAMTQYGVTPAETIMVGDRAEDEMAAHLAGCGFIPSWEFFGREEPNVPRVEGG